MARIDLLEFHFKVHVVPITIHGVYILITLSNFMVQGTIERRES